MGAKKLARICGNTLNTKYSLIKRTHTLLSFAFRRQGVSDASLLERAEMLWFRYAMKETKKAHSDGHLKKLYLEERDGLIVVVGRASAGLSRICGKGYLPVMMANSRIAVLIMLWAHYENHDDRDITMLGKKHG